MSDQPAEQAPDSPQQQPFLAPPSEYGELPQQPYFPPQQPYGPQLPYYQPRLPGNNPHRTRNIILAVVGAFVLIAVIGAAVELLVSGRPSPASTSTSASASSSAGTLTVPTWYTNDVKPTVNKLSADYDRLRTDGNNNNGPAIVTDCQQMLTDVHAAQSELPVADPTLESEWTKVLGDFSAGASDCVSAAKNGDSSLGDRARTEFLQGNTDAGKLASDLEKLANGG